MFTDNFNRFTYIGDNIRCVTGDLSATATIVEDYDTIPEDSEGFSDKDIAGWESEEWFFGAIALKIECNGILIHSHMILSGIEINLIGSNSYLQGIANELLMDALPIAKRKIEELIQKLQGCKSREPLTKE